MDHGSAIQPALTVGVDEAAMILSSVIRGFDSSFVDSFNFIMQNQKAHAEESNSKSLMGVLRITFPRHGK